MKRILSFIETGLLLVLAISSSAMAKKPSQTSKPKLVIGIVIDQMRWDFLYRYQKRYDEKGAFKTLLNQGFSCENIYIPYIPTVTASGHSSIYTGSTPSIHGIVGNEWYDRIRKKSISSVYDEKYGSSPRNMNGTTIGDQLKMASQFKSKNFSIALKDRSSILAGGHACDAAFWWNEKNGTWQTSSYYSNVPTWVETYSAKKLADSFYQLNWQPLYDIKTYINSSDDKKNYEEGFIHKDSTSFHYNLQKFIQKDYKAIMNTPFGMALTFDFAKTIIQKEQLGKNSFDVTDMLTVSISSTDIIGHLYGPFSVETEDTYLRLDKYLAEFIQFLDKQIGRENFILFLSADHGVSPIPEYLNENHIDLGGRFSDQEEYRKLNDELKSEFHVDSLVSRFGYHQLYLNQHLIKQRKLNNKQVAKKIIDFYQQQNNVLYAFQGDDISTYTMPQEIKRLVENSYHHQNSGDVQFIYKSYQLQCYDNQVVKTNKVCENNKGTTHGAWNSYDSHIPLIFFGGNLPKGKSYKKYFITDIATTMCAILQIEAPSSSIGNVIREVVE